MEISKTDALAAHIEKNGWEIIQRKQISYGVQLTVTRGGIKSNIRLYENKKGATTLDTSQVKEEALIGALSSFIQNKEKARPESDIIVPPPLIGSDEAGKGDYIGPLTVCAVYADEKMYAALIAAGVKDSKKLSDDAISSLAEKIDAICPHKAIVVIKNRRFNEMYEKTPNINEILAWAHATAVKKAAEASGCKNILIDKFGTGERTARYLSGNNFTLTQEPKAERNAAVAAASILARNAYMTQLKAMSKEYGVNLTPGAGEAANDTMRELVRKHGAEKLYDTVKISFKNTEKILKK